MAELIKDRYYGSPRWSSEITDCSVPMSFDTYSACSYGCLYCFSFFQRTINGAQENYLNRRILAVNPEAVKRIFTDPDSSQFGPYVKRRLVMQWGGLSDPFDEYEREFGVGLELLKFFREIKYPITFSTKGAWWVDDDRYFSLFQGADFWHVKISIITLDEDKARRIEVRVPTPKERLHAIEKLASAGIGGVTLRLRPFIIGVSDDFEDLIRAAADAGADSVSTEFLCLESRNYLARQRYKQMSKVVGFDIYSMYKKYSPGQQGYYRLDRAVKRKYFERMANLCAKLGLRLHISDAHFKEWGCSGSCCALADGKWNYHRGQFTEAIVHARKHGTVRFSDIEPYMDWEATFKWGNASGFNTVNSERRAKFINFTMKDWVRWLWNHPNNPKSPYKYFEGALYPVGRDENGDVIYEYRGDPLPEGLCE